MDEELKRGVRRADLVLVITAPFFAVAAILLRNAGVAALQGLALAYFFGVLSAAFFVNYRAERRQEERDQ